MQFPFHVSQFMPHSFDHDNVLKEILLLLIFRGGDSEMEKDSEAGLSSWCQYMGLRSPVLMFFPLCPGSCLQFVKYMVI
jgi:hypothetical protein